MMQANFITLTTYYGKQPIPLNKILRIEAVSNYSKIYFEDGKTLVVSKILQWFEDKLANECFVRVHRSHLINAVFISDYNRKGNQIIILKDNSFFQVARRKQTLVRRFLENAMTA